MPLSVNNDLPSTVLHFDLTNENQLSPHTISVATLEWLYQIPTSHLDMTTYECIAECYGNFDDINSCKPITLDYTGPSSASEKATSNWSAVVMCNSRYHNADEKNSKFDMNYVTPYIVMLLLAYQYLGLENFPWYFSKEPHFPQVFVLLFWFELPIFSFMFRFWYFLCVWELF